MFRWELRGGVLFTVRSVVFETHVLVELGGDRREYVALLRRNNPRDVQVLTFYWKQLPAPQESDGR